MTQKFNPSFYLNADVDSFKNYSIAMPLDEQVTYQFKKPNKVVKSLSKEEKLKKMVSQRINGLEIETMSIKQDIINRHKAFINSDKSLRRHLILKDQELTEVFEPTDFKIGHFVDAIKTQICDCISPDCSYNFHIKTNEWEYFGNGLHVFVGEK